MQILAVVLEILLGLAFLGAGGQKLAGAESQKEMFRHLKYPGWFMYAAGAVELVGGLGMLAGLFSPLLAVLAALLLTAQMAGAVISHARVGDSAGKMAPASVLLVLAVVVLVLGYPTIGL